MRQVRLPGVTPPEHVVNVASVPHRSPFRYPGGKTWFVPRIRQWLQGLETRPVELIEPFAGGAIVGLTAAFESLAEHVTLVELDDDVAAVWQAIIESDEGEWLARQILLFDVQPDSVEKLLTLEELSLRFRALKTVVRNRINHGGILAPGSGKIKNGENGKGLASRWYPKTLHNRIMAISNIRERFTIVHGDGIEVLRANGTRRNVVFFIDPPYTLAGKRAGRRLYTHSELNHEELFRVASSLAGEFLMTYANTDEVREMSRYFGLEFKQVAMKNTHHARMTELVIGRNLDFFE